MKRIELMGKRFGHLTVIKEGLKDTRGRLRWLCTCDCGNTKIVYGYNLKNGNTKSCGCLRVEMHTTHGGSSSRLYSTWKGMLRRCYNRESNQFNNYGGRGIVVFFTCFEDFQQWALTNGYTDSLTIDRIATNGPYSRDNCRWVSMAVQSRNKRNNMMIEHPITGERLCAVDWSKRLGGNINLVGLRIRELGWLDKDAVTIKLRSALH